MKRFIEGESRLQSTLFPDQLDDYIAEDNPNSGFRNTFVRSSGTFNVTEGVPSLQACIFGQLSGIEIGKNETVEAVVYCFKVPNP